MNVWGGGEFIWKLRNIKLKLRVTEISINSVYYTRYSVYKLGKYQHMALLTALDVLCGVFCLDKCCHLKRLSRKFPQLKCSKDLMSLGIYYKNVTQKTYTTHQSK